MYIYIYINIYIYIKKNLFRKTLVQKLSAKHAYGNILKISYIYIFVIKDSFVNLTDLYALS